MSRKKIIPYETAEEFFDNIRSQGVKVVQCHGTFDLLHPGHVVHLKEARELGDILVVTITAEKYVNKGPGRPYFNDQLRAENMAAIEYVDYVVMIPHADSVDAIRVVKPHYYCKGKEYSDPHVDVTGNIHDDVLTVKKYGGEIRYVGSVVFSSSKLLNNFFSHLPEPTKKFCSSLSKSVSPDEFRKIVDSFSDLKVLVVGDIIFDLYATVTVQGLTSKNRILSTRFVGEENQAGGAMAVYRQMKQFTGHVHLMGLTGTEAWVEKEIRKYILPEDDLIVRDESVTTIVKKRFVEPLSEGKELSKLFSVNYIDAHPPGRHVVNRLVKALNAHISQYDMVVVADFGHGMMHDDIREHIQNDAKFMALNCQTNSNNHGFNIINHQYRRADCFSLDEMELLLACGKRHIDHLTELIKLRNSLRATYAWLTRGAIETIGLEKSDHPVVILPLETQVIDTVGAGDAFFSVAALSARKGLPLDLATFIGQLAGGQAVKVPGNMEPVSKQKLLKSGMALLNY